MPLHDLGLGLGHVLGEGRPWRLEPVEECDVAILSRPASRRASAPQEVLPRLGAPGKASPASYKGKVVLLNFWASWCPPCTQELPLLEKTQKRIEPHGGLVLGVNTRDASEDAMAFVDRFKLTFPSLRDGSGDYAERWGLTGYPESFVLDREGKVAAARRGPVDQAWIDAHVMPLL